VTIVSGGMDSVTLAYALAQRTDDQRLVSFNYGQRHARELACAAQCAEALGLEWELIGLPDVAQAISCAHSSLVNPNVDVPHGHYAADSMRATIVPNRNMMMLSIAAAIAVAHEYDTVAFAAHGGDHFVYPDCRDEFVRALTDAIWLATLDESKAPVRGVELHAPFVNHTKADIASLGAELGVPFEDTWSCYEGGDVHCGKCGTCVERIEALRDAGVADLTEYAP
jgi:7-cyano-7-deazaguanine synthase